MRVVPYEPRHREGFVRLNRAWIERSFRLEDNDLDLFENLDERVSDGAVILIREEGGEVVATCMASPLEGGAWELEKLTTAEGLRGRGIGTAMLRACLDEVRSRGARKVVLLTNSALRGAMGMYRREGFAEVPLDPSWGYDRADVQMELTLRDASSGRRPS